MGGIGEARASFSLMRNAAETRCALPSLSSRPLHVPTLVVRGARGGRSGLGLWETRARPTPPRAGEAAPPLAPRRPGSLPPPSLGPRRGPDRYLGRQPCASRFLSGGAVGRRSLAGRDRAPEGAAAGPGVGRDSCQGEPQVGRRSRPGPPVRALGSILPSAQARRRHPPRRRGASPGSGRASLIWRAGDGEHSAWLGAPPDP